MKKIVTTAFALALGASLAIAAPQGGKHQEKRGGKGMHEGMQHGKGMRDGTHHGMQKGQMGARFAEKLNLTEAQREEFRSLHESFRTQNQPAMEMMRQTRTDYRAAREAGDTARAEQLRATMEAQRTQMQGLREAQHQRMLSILTEEQRAQFEAMKAEKGSRKGERGKARGERGMKRHGAPRT
jgi:Spy/CpxP family protein refolding chaperone